MRLARFVLFFPLRAALPERRGYRHPRRSLGDAATNEVVVRVPALATAIASALLLASTLSSTAMASGDAGSASDASTLLPVTASPNATGGDSEIKNRLAGPGTL